MAWIGSHTASGGTTATALWCVLPGTKDSSGRDRFPLEGGQEDAALLGDRDVFFQADEAGRGGHAQLQGEDVAGLDGPLGGGAVAGPARPQPRAAVVHRPAWAVPQTVLELRVARLQHDTPGRGGDLVADDPGTQHRRTGLDGPRYDVERLADVFRRRRLALAADVPHALQVGAVAVQPHAEVDVDQAAGRDAQVVARAGVTRLGLRADVDDGAGLPAPGRLQAPAAELGMQEVRQPPVADAYLDLRRQQADDPLRHADRPLDALDLGRRLAAAQPRQQRRGMTAASW